VAQSFRIGFDRRHRSRRADNGAAPHPHSDGRRRALPFGAHTNCIAAGDY
jgi:hypothetical protein